MTIVSDGPPDDGDGDEVGGYMLFATVEGALRRHQRLNAVHPDVPAKCACNADISWGESFPEHQARAVLQHLARSIEKGLEA